MNYAIFLDIFKFSHITCTKEMRGAYGWKLKINVVRGLQFERIIKFAKAKQFFENVSMGAIETPMKSKVTPEDVILGSEAPSRLGFQDL